MADAFWEANTVRLSLFPREPLPPSPEYWRPIFGEEPEGVETRPREGLKRQFGIWNDALAELQTSPIRFDLFVGPAPPNPVTGLSVLPSITIGSMHEWLDSFATTIAPFLERLPFEIVRVGVSGCAFADGETVEGAYGILRQHIKSFDIKPDLMRDILYRVNWRKHSNITEYYNDLQTWAAVNSTVQGFVNDQSPHIKIQQKNYAQLQYDANTPADRAEALDIEAIVPIFHDLLTLVRQGITDGERPTGV